MKLLTDRCKIEAWVVSGPDADLFTEYALIAAVFAPVCAQRQDSGLPVDCNLRKDLVGSRLGPKKIDKYSSLRVTSLVG
jgi:hypothetical protein